MSGTTSYHAKPRDVIAGVGEPVNTSVHVDCEYAGLCPGSILNSKTCLNPCKAYREMFGLLEQAEFQRH